MFSEPFLLTGTMNLLQDIHGKTLLPVGKVNPASALDVVDLLAKYNEPSLSLKS